MLEDVLTGGSRTGFEEVVATRWSRWQWGGTAGVTGGGGWTGLGVTVESWSAAL